MENYLSFPQDRPKEVGLYKAIINDEELKLEWNGSGWVIFKYNNLSFKFYPINLTGKSIYSYNNKEFIKLNEV